MEDKTFFDEGRYRGRVASQALGESSKGNPQFVLSFDLLGRYDTAAAEGLAECEAYERTMWLTITDKTVEFIADDLSALGFTGGSFGRLDPNHTNHQSFVGQEVDVFCEYDVWQDVRRERWRLSSGGGFVVKPLDADKVRTLDALFGSALKPAPAAAADELTKEAAATVVTGDEIPF